MNVQRNIKGKPRKYQRPFGNEVNNFQEISKAKHDEAVNKRKQYLEMSKKFLLEDRVVSEHYAQLADHYVRVINEYNKRNQYKQNIHRPKENTTEGSSNNNADAEQLICSDQN